MPSVTAWPVRNRQQLRLRPVHEGMRRTRLVDANPGDHLLVVTHSPTAAIAQATFKGERGHPVRISRELWDEAIDVARGDEGATRLIRGRDDVAGGDDMDVP